MKKFLIFTSLGLMLIACTHFKRFKVYGKLEGSAGKFIHLNEMTSVDYIPIDSTRINEHGEFYLKGKSDKIAFYMLSISKKNYITLIISPGEKIYVTGSSKDLPHSYFVKGSKDSELAKTLNDKVNKSLSEIDSLHKIYEDSAGSPHILQIRSKLDSAYNNIETKQREYSISFIKNNLNSLAGIMALYQELSPRRSLFNPIEYYDLYKKVDSIMMMTYPDADAVQSLHSLMNEVTDQKRNEFETKKKVAVGAIAPEIALPSPFGEIIKLSSLRGKFVLVDFWASWLSQCRNNNKNLVYTYWKYKNMGFEIFQVSIERKKESWVNAIRQDGLAWMNVSDIKMWESPVSALYNIKEIPQNLLLDPKGKIIAKNIFGKELENKMKEIFKY